MAELRNYSQIVIQDGESVVRFPPSVNEPLFTKSVGDNVLTNEFILESGRDEIETLWEYDGTDKVFDVFAVYNASDAGVVNLVFEIVKMTSATDHTPDGAWATFVSTIQLSCGAMFQLDDPYTEITSTRNNMGALTGSNPYPLAAADGDVTTGYIRKIKASNPGTTNVKLKTLTVWSDE